MMNSIRSNIQSIAFFSLLILSGCRFGNYAEPAKPIENPSRFKSIEMFFTAPKTLLTRVVLNSLGGPDMVIHTNSNAPLSSIPNNLLNVLTDPVYFATPTSADGYPIFRDNRDSVSMATQTDALGNISMDYIPADGPFPLWVNENCITNFEITQSGSFDRSHPGQVQYENGTIANVAGSLNLTYTFTRVIESINGPNHCDDDLSRLAYCFSNGAGCSTNELSASRTMFDLYVRQTGVLNIQDATKIKALEYIVTYE